MRDNEVTKKLTLTWEMKFCEFCRKISLKYVPERDQLRNAHARSWGDYQRSKPGTDPIEYSFSLIY